MKIIRDKIYLDELKTMANNSFSNIVKSVVDIERQIMAIDAELHSDEEALLIEDGSKNEDLWGINLYPELKDDNWIEFDSMINLRPAHGNRSRGIEDSGKRERIIQIVNRLVAK